MTTQIVQRDALLALVDTRGWTLKQLATEASVSYSLVRKLSNGDRATCSEASIRRIAQALGVGAEFLAKPRTNVARLNARTLRAVKDAEAGDVPADA